MSASDDRKRAARAAMQDRLDAERARSAERIARKRAAAAEKMAARREDARAVLARRRQDPRRKRRWPWLLLLLALLLLLVPDCQCRQPESKPAAPLPVPAEAAPTPEVEPPPPSPPGTPRAARPGFRAAPPPVMTWVDAFHLQVSARAPRLSRCFVGVPAPGTLRWTTAVTPTTGRVDDHELEPVLTGADLSRDQRRCVLEALSEPPYQLDDTDAPSTPVRVGMVLEF